MIKNNFFALLSCPKCKGELKVNGKTFKCVICRNTYCSQDGISRLIFGKESIDVRISEEKWDMQYKKNTLSKLLAYRNHPIVTSQEAFLLQYKPYFEGQISLDLGCGVAWSSLFMAEQNALVLSLDISFQALQISKMLLKNYGIQNYLVQADLLNLPIKDNSFDFIYWGLSIQYVKNTKLGVCESYRVLKPGGRIVVTFPVFSLSTFIYLQLRGGDIPRVPIMQELMEFLHINVLKGKYMHYGYSQTFTIHAMKKYFREAGFRIKEVAFLDIYYPIVLAPKIVRPLLQTLLHHRMFWPFAYIEAIK